MYWRHPEIRYYSHEPFETTYFNNASLDKVSQFLQNPIDIKEFDAEISLTTGTSLVIKEMPYQVGPKFPSLVSLTDNPIFFLLRDPRLNIKSRMEKKIEVGDNPLFPLKETGWELIHEQIQYCKTHDIPHFIVDSLDFRNQPEKIFPQIFEQLRLKFSEDMLSWRSRTAEVNLDNLDGAHMHLYEEVLDSDGILPETSIIPPLTYFPIEKGFREHVQECLTIYEQLQFDPAKITI